MRLFLSVLASLSLAAAPSWSPRERLLTGESLSGAALSPDGSLVTWGDRVRTWNPRTLESRSIAAGPFGEGGCLLDGGRTFISVRGTGLGELAAIRIADGTVERIDTEVEMHDCLEATLFGRTGLLMIQRGMQVRFYERGKDGRWSSRDIYSIYTPSYQTGLALADVNGDGLTDIFCGNYWIRSPKTFEESWQIFAINTWFEDAQSASLRIAALSPGVMVAAQAHMSPARIARFDAPADPVQEWPATPLARGLTLSGVHGLAPVGTRIVAGESNGPASRLLSIDPETGSAEIIAKGTPVLSVVPLNERTFVTAGPAGLTVWSQRPRR